MAILDADMDIIDLNHRETVSLQSSPDFFSAQVAQSRRFYFDLNPPASDLTVVCGGLEHCTADYAIHRATFSFFCLEYVVRGKGALRFGETIDDLKSGSVFAYGPGLPLDITSSPDEPLAKYFVCFLGSLALTLLDACGLGVGRMVLVYPAQSLTLLFEELIQSGLSGGRFGGALSAQLLHCLMLKVRAAAAPADSRETAAFATYRRCRKHIEKHFLRLQTLAEIAAEGGVSAAYLCRLFRRYEHASPYQFLVRLKMHYAAELLAAPDMLVKQAAEKVGFGDTLHFYRVFRRVLGIPPSDFRGVH